MQNNLIEIILEIKNVNAIQEQSIKIAVLNNIKKIKKKNYPINDIFLNHIFIFYYFFFINFIKFLYIL